MKAPSFQFYAQDFLTGIMYLTNEEVGIYIKMLAKQWTDKKIPKKRLGLFVGLEWDSFSLELKGKFIDKGEYIINERLEIEREKKEKFFERQSINGKKGGRPKINKPKLNPNVTQKKPLEDEDEKENEKEDVIVYEKEEIDFEKIINIFNSVCNNLPTVKKLTVKRKSAINARVNEYNLLEVGNVFKLVRDSAFLNGESDLSWQADFDWIMNPNNFIKILEGKYKNKPKQNKTKSTEGSTGFLNQEGMAAILGN